MSSFAAFLDEIKTFFVTQFTTFRVSTIIDLVIVAYLIYKVIIFVKETRAVQLVKGVIFLLILMQISEILKMNTTNYILTNTMQVGIIAILIVFQPEMRRALEEVGRTKLGRKFLSSFEGASEEQAKRTMQTIESVCQACEHLSRERMGAIIVFERTTKIGDIIKSGTMIDAQVTPELLVSIFFPNNPVHDGAVIIRDNRIHAAGCFLPLTQNIDLSKELGTRHRASIGMSENSDAVVVVVSEETGKISIAVGGDLTRNYKVESLRQTLENYLVHRPSQSGPIKGIKKFFRGGKKK